MGRYRFALHHHFRPPPSQLRIKKDELGFSTSVHTIQVFKKCGTNHLFISKRLIYYIILLGCITLLLQTAKGKQTNIYVSADVYEAKFQLARHGIILRISSRACCRIITGLEGTQKGLRIYQAQQTTPPTFFMLKRDPSVVRFRLKYCSKERCAAQEK